MSSRSVQQEGSEKGEQWKLQFSVGRKESEQSQLQFSERTEENEPTQPGGLEKKMGL